MPELPEVETIKNELEPHVVGRRVTGISLLWEGIVREPSVNQFRARLIGQRITGLTRRGKYLSFSLGSGERLVIHLKMSGSLLLKGNSTNDRFVRAVTSLDDGMELYFRDPRKFGRMWLVADNRTIVDKLGPEPLEASFTVKLLTGLRR